MFLSEGVNLSEVPFNEETLKDLMYEPYARTEAILQEVIAEAQEQALKDEEFKESDYKSDWEELGKENRS